MSFKQKQHFQMHFVTRCHYCSDYDHSWTSLMLYTLKTAFTQLELELKDFFKTWCARHRTLRHSDPHRIQQPIMTSSSIKLVFPEGFPTRYNQTCLHSFLHSHYLLLN